MSDPVTNAEVEDVLSSIRRLVSEDKRPVQAPKPEPKTDRLVLTPALRVGSDEGPTQDQTRPEAAAQEAVPEVSYTPESLVTHDSPLDVYEDTTASAAPVAHPVEEEDLFDDPAHDYADDPYHFDDETDRDGDGEEEEIVLNLADVDMDPAETAEENAEPVEDPSPVLVLSPTEALVPEAEDTISDAPVAGTVPDAAPEPAPLTAEETKAATLTAKIAALETAIGQISETWEPDDPGDSDYAGTEPAETLTWQDDEPQGAAVEPPESMAPVAPPAPQDHEPQDMAEFGAIEDRFKDPQDEVSQAAAPVPPVSRSLDDLDETQLIDEEALRDLVSEIVRAELQGALGERITRNVRKLVRREIHRALATKELE